MQTSTRASRADYQAYLDWEMFNRIGANDAMEDYPNWKEISEKAQLEDDLQWARDVMRRAVEHKERKDAQIGCLIFGSLAVFSVLPWVVGVLDIAAWVWKWIGGGR